MLTFEEDLKKAVEFHGHLCSGQVLGVRMGRICLRYFKIDEPNKYRDLVGYVEVDRCIADAICSVTGCRMGKRRLKWFDYGKMAASFLDLQTNKAIRISVIGDHMPKEGEDLVEFFSHYSDEELFRVNEVTIDIKPDDLPGSSLNIVTCENCGEKVFDNRHLNINGKTICRGCANGNYYEVIK